MYIRWWKGKGLIFPCSSSYFLNTNDYWRQLICSVYFTLNKLGYGNVKTYNKIFMWYIFRRCVICQMDYKRGDRQMTLPCKHVYHSGCISRWLSINKVNSAEDATWTESKYSWAQREFIAIADHCFLFFLFRRVQFASRRYLVRNLLSSKISRVEPMDCNHSRSSLHQATSCFSRVWLFRQGSLMVTRIIFSSLLSLSFSFQ